LGIGGCSISNKAIGHEDASCVTNTAAAQADGRLRDTLMLVLN
jgi:hypothetical protein